MELGSQSQRIAEVAAGVDGHVCISVISPEVSVRKSFSRTHRISLPSS